MTRRSSSCSPRLGMLAGVGMLSLPVVAPAQQPPQKVVFALNWFAVGDHAAYWVAVEKGYYKDKGLDVELQNSKGSGDSIAKVDTGRADIGLADATVVIPRVAQGAKIKVVGAIFDNTPLNIWTRKDAGIAKPKDLEGKTLAAPPGDAQRMLFPAFARAQRRGREQGEVAQHRARREVRRAEREARGRGAGLHDGTAVLGEGGRQGQPRAHAVAPVRVRHVLDVDLRQREDDEASARRCSRTSSRRRTAAGAT